MWYFFCTMYKSAGTAIVEISRMTMGNDWEYATCWKLGTACKTRRFVTMWVEIIMLLDTSSTSGMV